MGASYEYIIVIVLCMEIVMNTLVIVVWAEE